MTESEFWRLTPSERRAMPREVTDRIGAHTREESREILTLEGWTFVAIREPEYDEGEEVRATTADDETEVWFRQAPGGPAEWCELWCNDLLEDLWPDRAWVRVHFPIDPRLIEV